MTAKRRDFKAGAMIPVVVATFRYEDDEITKIEADLGPGALTSPEFTVMAAATGQPTKTFSQQHNEAAVVRHLRSQLDLGAAAAQPLEAARTCR